MYGSERVSGEKRRKEGKSPSSSFSSSSSSSSSSSIILSRCLLSFSLRPLTVEEEIEKKEEKGERKKRKGIKVNERGSGGGSVQYMRS